MSCIATCPEPGDPRSPSAKAPVFISSILLPEQREHKTAATRTRSQGSQLEKEAHPDEASKGLIGHELMADPSGAPDPSEATPPAKRLGMGFSILGIRVFAPWGWV